MLQKRMTIWLPKTWQNYRVSVIWLGTQMKAQRREGWRETEGEETVSCLSLQQNEQVHPKEKKSQHVQHDRASQHINTLLKNTYLHVNTWTLWSLYSEWRVWSLYRWSRRLWWGAVRAWVHMLFQILSHTFVIRWIQLFFEFAWTLEHLCCESNKPIKSYLASEQQGCRWVFTFHLQSLIHLQMDDFTFKTLLAFPQGFKPEETSRCLPRTCTLNWNS